MRRVMGRPDKKLQQSVLTLHHRTNRHSNSSVSPTSGLHKAQPVFAGDLAVLIVPGGIDEANGEPNRALEWVNQLEGKLQPVKDGVKATGDLLEGSLYLIVRMQARQSDYH